VNTTITRKEQKEQTKRSLIVAAANLFAQEGISATATADVAKSLKLSHGTVFLHFPKRDDLVLAVIDDFGARLSSELQKSIGNESRLERILRAHLNTLAEFEDFYFRILTELHLLPDSIRSTIFMLNSAVSWKMFEAAAPMIKAGQIKKLDRASFFNTWIALVHYYVINRDQFCTRRPILSEVGEMLVKHFLNLVQK
jgi:AcrR family transcriptional regulator